MIPNNTVSGDASVGNLGEFTMCRHWRADAMRRRVASLSYVSPISEWMKRDGDGLQRLDDERSQRSASFHGRTDGDLGLGARVLRIPTEVSGRL